MARRPPFEYGSGHWQPRVRSQTLLRGTQICDRCEQIIVGFAQFVFGGDIAGIVNLNSDERTTAATTHQNASAGLRMLDGSDVLAIWQIDIDQIAPWRV